MNAKKRRDFSDHAGWTAYVSCAIPADPHISVLALGRTELFRRFYELRGQPFPETFGQEPERIAALKDPARTAALESLDGSIFASLIGILSAVAGLTLARTGAVEATSSRDQTQALLGELDATNPYFALCSGYRQQSASVAIGIVTSSTNSDRMEKLMLPLCGP
jgi:hypothetical protein